MLRDTPKTSLRMGSLSASKFETSFSMNTFCGDCTAAARIKSITVVRSDLMGFRKLLQAFIFPSLTLVFICFSRSNNSSSVAMLLVTIQFLNFVLQSWARSHCKRLGYL